MLLIEIDLTRLDFIEHSSCTLFGSSKYLTWLCFKESIKSYNLMREKKRKKKYWA